MSTNYKLDTCQQQTIIPIFRERKHLSLSVTLEEKQLRQLQLLLFYLCHRLKNVFSVDLGCIIFNQK